jgi:hypothetical protein
MNDALNTKTTDELFKLLTAAMGAGSYRDALALADEICRAERRDECSDLIVPARNWPAFRNANPGMLQPLADRIDLYNSYRE